MANERLIVFDLQLINELRSTVGPCNSFILVDEEQIRSRCDLKSRAIPFLERNGDYWGPPADDQAAIQELNRLRSAGGEYIVFISPTFWWLDHYASFHRYLQTNFRLVVNNKRLIVFDLRDQTGHREGQPN